MGTYELGFMIPQQKSKLPDGMFDGVDLDEGPLDGLPGGRVPDHALDPHVHLGDVGEEGLPVVLPEGAELLGGRVLEAAELEGDLKVVGGEIVEVLHPTAHGVPEAIYLDRARKKNKCLARTD